MAIRTYVAGHSGLVGSALWKRLSASSGRELLKSDYPGLDLRRQAETERFFSDSRIEEVFLAAAKVGGIVANSTYKAEFIYDNLAIALNSINSAYKAGVKKLLNLGSSCIYPKMAEQPIKEASLLSGPLEATNEPYAVAKIAALKLCRYYNEQYGTNYISVMPTNLYGPNDNFNLETAHVMPAMIRKLHLAKLLRAGDFRAIAADAKARPVGFGYDKTVNWTARSEAEAALNKLGIAGGSVTLWGTGEVYREFLYSEDLADACVFLMESWDAGDIGEIINIGTGVDIKLKELASQIKEIVGFEGDIYYDRSKPDGTPRKVVDVSRLNALGWKPKVQLRDGIRSVYSAYSVPAAAV